MTSLAGAAFKRSVDVVGALIGLLILAVPFILVALAIKMDSRGPVFFRQQRVGRNGETIVPWKLRTMVEGAAGTGLGLNVAEHDLRITRVGRLLRAISLDEMPQLINVLQGNMSLVGPRPTLRYQVDRYTQEQRRRLLAKPGITGLAAVTGRNSIPWARRIEIDIHYVDHWSPWLDLKIMALTPWVAWVSRKGLYGEGGVNDDFGGTPRGPESED